MQTTFVYVTHDQAEALTLADRIVVMNDGVIQQIGTPDEIYERPAQHVRRLVPRQSADQLPAGRDRERRRQRWHSAAAEMSHSAAAGRRHAREGRRRPRRHAGHPPRGRGDAGLSARHAHAERCGRFRAAGRLRPLSRAQGRRLQRLRARRQGKPASGRRDRDARRSSPSGCTCSTRRAARSLLADARNEARALLLRGSDNRRGRAGSARGARRRGQDHCRRAEPCADDEHADRAAGAPDRHQSA